MILTKTLTKKILEQIIKECFSKFGSFQCSLLLDSLKFLGFYYATKSGLSINIEDLKTPEIKKQLLEENDRYIKKVSEDWYQGKISDTERFQSIIDQWNVATEFLKNKIIDFYQTFDPANNLYIMSFSGARGNMSQVRQLIGMRGLMADQEGNIIDLPIQNNFREGLTSLDYLISAYGARKGVVDTALKTADSGYLTRRLIYVAQDLIIREIDCKTKNGIFIDLNKNFTGENLIGRYLVSTFKYQEEFTNLFQKPINENSLNLLKKKKNLKFKIRSCLTCASSFSICQKCYGWDLSKRNIVSLGEAVGIIAAQSIGEPGTQLTMRTFHTGGIFTSELLQQNLAPFSGKLIFPEKLPLIKYRTNHGLIVSKTQEEIKLKLINWEGKEKVLTVPFGSFLYKEESGFVKKGELISEESSRESSLALKRLKPVYSPIEGQISFENLEIDDLDFKKIKICADNGILWIRAGKLLSFPFESKINLRKNKIKKEKSIAKLKIISPFSGLFQIEKDLVKLLRKEDKIEILFSKLTLDKINKTNVKVKINSICKDNQFIDEFTIVSYIYITAKEDYKIYGLKTFNKSELKNFFLIRNLDIWTTSTNEVRKKYLSFKSKRNIKSNEQISKTLVNKESGYLLKKDGLTLTFQKTYPVFLTQGSLLNYSENDFIYKGKNLASLVNYRQQTEDIVQGLPKIDDLVEARSPKNSAFLLAYPSLILKLKAKDYDLLEIQLKQNTFDSNIRKKIFSFKAIPLPKSKKAQKEKLKDFRTPSYCILSLGTKIVKKNKKADLIAKRLGSSRKELFLQTIYRNMSFIDLVQPITEGVINSHDLLKSLNLYHRKRSGSVKGSIISLNKFQLVLVNSIQAIYTSQGVEISTKHIEIITRQMTSKAKIISSIDKLPFFENETVRLSFMIEIGKALIKKKQFWKPVFEPILLSSTAISLNKTGFLAAAGFQETKRVLSKAALEGRKDWINGLKECIITGRLLPAGSSFLNYKNYLDTLYLYKESEQKKKHLSFSTQNIGKVQG